MISKLCRSDFTAAKARQDEIAKIMTEIKELFPDTEIEDVPEVFEGLQATKRKLDKEYRRAGNRERRTDQRSW